MEIYLVRHTEVKVPKTVCYGQSVIELRESFSIEKDKVMAKLQLAKPVFAFTSTQPRVLKLAQHFDPEVILEERLRELNFGDWEMKNWEDIPETELKLWQEHFVRIAPPNGETYSQLSERVLAFWNEKIYQPFSNQPVKIVIFSHIGVMRALVCHLLGMPLENAFRLNFDYGSVTKFTQHKKNFVLNYSNK